MMEKLGWDEATVQRMGKAAPAWYEMPIPISDSNGKGIILSLGWLLPFGELGMITWTGQQDVTSNLLQYTPLFFKGMISTGFNKTSWGSDLTKEGDPDWMKKYTVNLVTQYMPHMLGTYWVQQYKNTASKAAPFSDWIEPTPKQYQVPWTEKAFVAPAVGMLRHENAASLVAKGQKYVLQQLRFLEDEKRAIESDPARASDMAEVTRHNARATSLIAKTAKEYRVPVSMDMFKRYTIDVGTALQKSAKRKADRDMMSPLQRSFR
jgi:hypothetical protein